MRRHSRRTCGWSSSRSRASTAESNCQYLWMVFVALRLVRGRSLAGCGWATGLPVGPRPQPHPLLGGDYGDHVLVEQVVEGHRLVAVRARAADVDAAGGDWAGRGAVVIQETVLAA